MRTLNDVELYLNDVGSSVELNIYCSACWIEIIWNWKEMKSWIHCSYSSPRHYVHLFRGTAGVEKMVGSKL